MTWRVIEADCVEAMAAMPEASVDAVVCDPLEGFQFVGVEREPEYAAIARARIAWWQQHPEGVEIVKALESERTRQKIEGAGQVSLFDMAAEPMPVESTKPEQGWQRSHSTGVFKQQ